jgi:hypothetical protein
MSDRTDVIEDFLNEQVKQPSSTANEQEEFSDDEVEDVVQDLANTDFSSADNQGKFAELIEGLSFSENELATEFIAELQSRADDVAESIGVDV